MMIIYKVKGLEFEMVILFGLYCMIGGNESSLLFWDEVVGVDGVEYLLVVLMKVKGVGNGELIIYDYLKKLEGECVVYEDECLFYVVVICVICCLYLVGVVSFDVKCDDGLWLLFVGILFKLFWLGVV